MTQACKVNPIGSWKACAFSSDANTSNQPSSCTSPTTSEPLSACFSCLNFNSAKIVQVSNIQAIKFRFNQTYTTASSRASHATIPTQIRVTSTCKQSIVQYRITFIQVYSQELASPSIAGQSSPGSFSLATVVQSGPATSLTDLQHKTTSVDINNRSTKWWVNYINKDQQQ